jgi:hypothetical protein
MKRARTFTQWLNEAEQNSPWFIPVSAHIADILMSNDYKILNFSEVTGEITVELSEDLVTTSLQWPNADEHIFFTKIIVFTLVYHDFDSGLEKLYQVKAKEDPASFLDDVKGFQYVAKKRLWSEDIDLDYEEVEYDEFIEFIIDDAEDFEEELIDFIEDAKVVIAFDEDQLREVLRDRFPFEYYDYEED